MYRLASYISFLGNSLSKLPVILYFRNYLYNYSLVISYTTIIRVVNSEFILFLFYFSFSLFFILDLDKEYDVALHMTEA